MDDQQRGRIERYVMNANRFIWGLGQVNQKKNYTWLEDNGFKFTRARYGLVIQQLLRYPGIEELLGKLIIPTTKKYFPVATLNVLREYWNRGERPNLSILKGLDVNRKGDSGVDRAFHWRPFAEIDTQFHYVERWGDLAGVWFEEIEPWVKDSASYN